MFFLEDSKVTILLKYIKFYLPSNFHGTGHCIRKETNFSGTRIKVGGNNTVEATHHSEEINGQMYGLG